jgi:tetratricopeptide (TPR) repeat protein
MNGFGTTKHNLLSCNDGSDTLPDCHLDFKKENRTHVRSSATLTICCDVRTLSSASEKTTNLNRKVLDTEEAVLGRTPPLRENKMAQEWYYSKDGERQGPVTPQQLKQLAASGDLQPTDLIWKEGMDDWVQASKVKRLFSEKTGREKMPPAVPLPARDEQREILSFQSSLAHGGKYATVIGGVCGFAADFLTPLGPFNGYLAVVAALCCATFFLLWRRLAPEQRSNWDLTIPHQAMIFSVYLLLAFGFWFGAAALSGSSDNGVIGGNVAVVAQFQKTLLGIESTVRDIKSDTTEILAETKKISGNIDELGKLGGIIKEPSTPSDYYHNARVHELSGDFRQAFDAYERYVSFDQPFIDPIDSYLALLKSQNGYRAAVQEFLKLKSQFPSSTAIEFVSLRLETGQERLNELDRYASSHPEFGPALLDLADFFSASQMPNRSGVDVEKERSYLEKLVEAAATGKFDRYFLDKKLADRLLADARGRLTANEDVSASVQSNQKVFLANHNEVWVMDNTATNIFYSFDQKEWKAVTKLVKTILLRRGTISDRRISDQSSEFVYVKYLDHRGQESRVFKISVESVKEFSAPKGLGQPIDPSRFTKDSLPGLGSPVQPR